MPGVESLILKGLTKSQKDAVRCSKRKLLVIAGAGSGKTDVMARRVVWLIAKEGVPKNKIVAFTFTERAAEEMKFRIRKYIELLEGDGGNPTLGGMYIGTIHGFCLKMLREMKPDIYHNFDVIDEPSRIALVYRGFFKPLGLSSLKKSLEGRYFKKIGNFKTIEYFLRAYDLLNEYDQLRVNIPDQFPPYDPGKEEEWCKKATLETKVGKSDTARRFSTSAARYYAYLRCRRFLDFSTSQTEFLRMIEGSDYARKTLREKFAHIVVDEVQDINPVQKMIIETLVGRRGKLTAVGDHRQAIFGWRGGVVDIMGEIYGKLKQSNNGEVIELEENFRSTERIIEIANEWAKTISPIGEMPTPDMKRGNKLRIDKDKTHVAALSFETRDEEAEWIANCVRKLVRADGKGAEHDEGEGKRGLTLSDIAVLLRSSTDARTYMEALEREGIPAVFRTGPDLFSRPEVLLFIGALALTAGINEFPSGAGPGESPTDRRSLKGRIRDVLGCEPNPEEVIKAACSKLERSGFPIDIKTAKRIIKASKMMDKKIGTSKTITKESVKEFRSEELQNFLRGRGSRRGRGSERVYPQKLYHYLLQESGVEDWDPLDAKVDAALFHLGQLSGLVKSMETPGWVSKGDFKNRLMALCLWGPKNARAEQKPLLMEPEAVTISTIHSAKGLEFPAVFLADVNARRFPNGYAKRIDEYPFEGKLAQVIDVRRLADNDNYDAERRLMYVAITRAERFLFISHNGRNKSLFFKEISEIIGKKGGVAEGNPKQVPLNIGYRISGHRREERLVTSFSELRYFKECPYDFYLRNVLGFAPTIDQVFGYGRGVHNILRAIHTNPAEYAKCVGDAQLINQKILELIDKGLFYLRYTTGEPLDRMRRKAVSIVAKYVKDYADDLAELQFEPEKEFEALIREANALIVGAIDVVRLDNPPRVSLIDFKSGEKESDERIGLDEEEMRLQVQLYGLAAKNELEYEPDKGMVIYLGDLEESDKQKKQLEVELGEKALKKTRKTITDMVKKIQSRDFFKGPSRITGGTGRCQKCDWKFCPMKKTT